MIRKPTKANGKNNTHQLGTKMKTLMANLRGASGE
jgi:hypothetical protein